MARSIVCTPEALIGENACTQCLSEQELWQVLAFILCKLNGGAEADCSASTLMEDAKCMLCVTNDKQWVEMLVNLFYRFTVNLGYLESGDLMQQASCLRCTATPQAKAIVLKQICTYLANYQS